jgi:hypothetical protein
MSNRTEINFRCKCGLIYNGTEKKVNMLIKLHNKKCEFGKEETLENIRIIELDRSRPKSHLGEKQKSQKLNVYKKGIEELNKLHIK